MRMRRDVGAYPVLRVVRADVRIAASVRACGGFAALRLAQVSRHERGDRSRRVAGQQAAACAACAAIERHLGTTLLPMHLFG